MANPVVRVLWCPIHGTLRQVEPDGRRGNAKRRFCPPWRQNLPCVRAECEAPADIASLWLLGLYGIAIERAKGRAWPWVG